MRYWDDISYLRRGSERQQDAFLAIIELDIFSILSEFDPLLAGTLPLGLDVPTSDLDIICCAMDLAYLAHVIERAFGFYDGFSVRHTQKDGLPTLVARFQYRTFPVEIFGQPLPTREQRAFRHMVVEDSLLRLAGEDAKMAIQQLRGQGINTEPAFGGHFCLDGDPYEALLDLADASAQELVDVLERASRLRR